MERMMRGLMWFREDLRLKDNQALYFAARQCSEIVGLYIIDRAFWRRHHIAACRVEFLLRGLKILSTDLAKRNIPLLIVEIEQTRKIPVTIGQMISEIGGQAVFFNRQYEVDEKRRDQAVQKYLASKNMACYSYDDQMILPPNSVKTQQGSYYKIFTPYQRAWRRAFSESKTSKLLPAPKRQAKMLVKSTPVPQAITGFHSSIDPKLWPAGENAAERRLRIFIKDKLFSYDKERDFPALPATSQLSAYLTSGMISPKTCFLAALKANQGKLTTGRTGALVWMNELIWRDFYKHLLIAAPRISMNKPFHLQTDRLPWVNDKKLFTAWSQGQTGVPIIDAAMRQLNTLGWMHNRLRMITAGFLAKNLQLDWRLGEQYFMSHLIDGDLAANNGGWQWCASTGADAMPYFRVFNPLRQSRRFDPDGKFIRQYCPELAHLPAKEIHDPSQRKMLGYPAIIIDLTASSQQFIAKYKKIILNSG